MRKFIFTGLMFVGTAFSLPLSAQVAPEGNGTTNSSRLSAPLQLPIDVGYTYFPTSADSDFRLTEASASGSAELTCSGVTLDGAISSMMNNVQSISGNLQNNAMGLALNYLIYSSPSLYSLVTNMKESFEMNLGASNLACNMARAAGKKNWDETSNEARVAQCLDKAGGLTQECLSGSEGTVYKFLDKKRQWSEDIQSAVDSADSFFDTDCETLNSDQPTLMKMVFARSPNRCKEIEIASDIFPDRKINETTGEMDPVAAKKTPTELISESALESRDLIDELVESRTEDMTNTDAYEKLANKGRIKLSYGQHRMLTQLKDEDPIRYEAYRDRLATLMAINEMETIALKLKVGLRSAAHTAGDVELGEDNKQFVLDQIEYILAVAELERKKITNQQQESDLLEQGYRLLEQSRVN